MPDESRLARLHEINRRLIAQHLIDEDKSKARRFDEVNPPTPWEECSEFTVTLEMNELYAYSLDDPNPWYFSDSPSSGPLAHPIALLQLGARPVLRRFPVARGEGESSMHAKMDVEFLRPPRVGERYREEGRLLEKYVRRGRRYLVTEGRFIDESGCEVLRYRHTRMVGKET